MKTINLLLLFLSAPILVIGQQINVEEPSFEGEIIFASESGNSIELEYQTASVKTKASMGAMLTGIGKVKSRVSVRGKISTAILPKQNTYYFIYNHGNNSKNPKNLAQLVKFEKKGKNRVAEISSVSVTTGAQSSGDVESIAFKGKKYQDSDMSYLLIVKNLEPGHYGWFVGEEANNNVHLFSIEEDD
tara:strand:+ start:54 stop:617 length:564 start_codon:yes stop_codon:yes gene_type:complete